MVSHAGRLPARVLPAPRTQPQGRRLVHRRPHAHRSARARGRKGGRRPSLTPDQAALAQQLHDTREKTVQQIAGLFGVPRSTVYGHLDREKTLPRQPERTSLARRRPPPCGCDQ
ncbi:helix-turn-helix domain-containing protein [Streptomyces caelestis]